MTNVKLSLGYYAERPYGQFAQTNEGREFRKLQHAFSERLVCLLDKETVPRTFFVLGEYLERCLEDFSIPSLKAIYNKDNALNDLGQHGYKHYLIRPVKGETQIVVTPAEFAKGLAKANKVIYQILGVKPSGLGIPYGYDMDLSDMPEILRHLSNLGFHFVSSNLRSGESLGAELTLERQPHTYAKVGFPNIVEIPSHGWQDAIFTAEKSWRFLNRGPDKREEIIKHYEGVFDRALGLSRLGNPIYINLCLHPWAVMEYDPNLDIHRRLIDAARQLGIEIISCRQAAEEVLARASKP